MSNDSYGNLLYDIYGDNSIVSNEKGDLFVRFRGNDYYTTNAGTKGDWLFRQYGDSLTVVRDSDGIAYARVDDGDWNISSLPRIYDTSPTSVAPVDTAGPVQEQSVTGGDNLSGTAWYDREWRKLAQEHPEWTEQQVTDKMSEQIWNTKYQLLIDDIANSGSPEEREQKIREYQWELDKYKASGINVDGHLKYLRDTQGMGTDSIFNKVAATMSKYSSDVIEPQYTIDPQNDAFVEDERGDRNSTWGISDDGMLYMGNAAGIPNSREMQKLEDRYKVYDSMVQSAGDFWEKIKSIQIGNSTQLTDADLEDGYQLIVLNDGLTYVRARYEGGSWVIHPDDMQLAQESNQAKSMLIDALIPGVFKVVGVGGKSLYKVLTQGSSKAEKVVGNFNPINKGSLPEAVANTFRSATYSQKVLEEDIILYRAYGGKAKELGQYWARTKPEGPLQTVIDSALDQSWGNTATQVAQIRVPKGTTIYEGFAASQGGLVGGGNQIYIYLERIDPSWLIK